MQWTLSFSYSFRTNQGWRRDKYVHMLVFRFISAEDLVMWRSVSCWTVFSSLWYTRENNIAVPSKYIKEYRDSELDTWSTFFMCWITLVRNFFRDLIWQSVIHRKKHVECKMLLLEFIKSSFHNLLHCKNVHILACQGSSSTDTFNK